MRFALIWAAVDELHRWSERGWNKEEGVSHVSGPANGEVMPRNSTIGIVQKVAVFSVLEQLEAWRRNAMR